MTDEGSDLVALGQSPAIALIKTGTLNDDDGVAGVSAGDTISYAFTVTNTGNVTLSGVTVDDPLVTVSGGPVSLAPGAVDTTSFTATYTITQADIDAGEVPNTATVTGTAPAGGTVTDEGSDLVALGQVPGMALVKTGVLDDADGNGLANVGETISYDFEVTNTGNVTLTGVSIADPLPGLSAISPASAEIAVGASVVFTATYAITQADIDAGEVFNSAVASSNEAPDSPADETVPLPQGPELTLLKTASFNDENGDGFGDAGETVSYAFTVTNSGTVTVTDITIDDPMTGLVLSGGPIPSLAPGESDATTFTATYALTQQDIENGVVTNIAIAVGEDPDGDEVRDESDDPETVEPDDPTDEPIPAAPSFDIGVTVDEPVVTAVLLVDPDTGETIEVTSYSPQELTYTVTVPNTGNVTLVNPELTFTVTQTAGDGTATVVDPFVITNGTLANPSDPSYPSEVVRVVLVGGDTDGDGELDVDETWVYQIVIAIDAQTAAESTQPGRGALTGTGTFVADDVRPQSASLEPQSDDDQTQVDIELTSPASPGNDLDIVKTTPRDTVRAGDIVPWFITVTNNLAGPERVDVIDTLPTGFSYREGTATVDGVAVTPIVSGNRVSLTGVTVPGAGSVTVRLDTLVGGRVRPGQYVNRAIFVDDGGGSEEATASVIVGAEPVFDCGTVIGKVFDDVNQNGYQDGYDSVDGLFSSQGTAPVGLVMSDDIFAGGKFGKGAKYTPPPAPAKAEKGIPGVRLVTVDGKIITTDEHGRFHVGCADLPRDGIGSNFLLKLDTRSLPSGYRLTTENPRVVRLTAGKMTKMNFGATISRLVRIDIADNAFVPGTNDPKPAFIAALGRSVPKFADQPVTVRISYRQRGEQRATINQRSRNVERLLRQYWQKSGKYRLMIEKTVQRSR